MQQFTNLLIIHSSIFFKKDNGWLMVGRWKTRSGGMEVFSSFAFRDEEEKKKYGLSYRYAFRNDVNAMLFE